LPPKAVLFSWARVGLTTVRVLVVVLALVALKATGAL
jgi:hypothetical protein